MNSIFVRQRHIRYCFWDFA